MAAGGCRSWQPQRPTAQPTISDPAAFHRSRFCGPRRSTRLAAAAAAAATSAAGAAPKPALPQLPLLRPIQPAPSQLTAEGFVPCTAALSAVPAELQSLLAATVAACRSSLGRCLVGVYVRGSVVQPGCFLSGISDADFLVLHLSDGNSSVDGGSVSAGLEAEVAAVEGLRAEVSLLQHQFPQCTKVELQVVPLPPSSALCPWAQRWQQQHEAGEAGGAATMARALLPPSALVGHALLAFQLKTQAVCLWGWDLPAVLPDVAALPPLHLLPDLVDSVASALLHAQRKLAEAAANEEGEMDAKDSSGSSSSSSSRLAALSAAARAVRWALKRCIRAALELSLITGSGSSSSSSGSRSSSSSSSGSRSSSGSSSGSGGSAFSAPSGSVDGRGSSTAAAAGAAAQPQQYSRDLYWCMHCASERLPDLRPRLTDALRLYVSLSGASFSGAFAPAEVQQRQAAVEAGSVAAAALAAKLDALFLQQMLTEEPGWLAHHQGDSSSSSRSSKSGSALRAGSRGSSWLQRLRVRAWAAAAGGSMESNLVGAPPPLVAAPVSGPVLTLDWRQPEARMQAASLIAAAIDGAANVAGLPPQPVLLKGAAAHWLAVQRWSLGSLAAAGLEGQARLAPSLMFPFTEPRLAALLAQQQGPAALPSCLLSMGATEFAARMQQGNPCGLPPLVYGHASTDIPGSSSCCGSPEFAYFQAELPSNLLADCDLSSPPFVLPAGWPGGGGSAQNQQKQRQQQRLHQTQAARLWAGPQGTVSPTHYDLSNSFLTQVRGRKRMLFWGPDQLPLLYFYPDTHLLRRRSRVNMHAPQPGRFPLFGRATAQEALLEPGDVVFFPSRWAHYTESLEFSLSVTCRFGGARRDQAE